MELYKKYRPQKLSEVIGQKTAIEPLVAAGREGRFPHAVLFAGPSGCGKTTLARIFRKKLKCVDIDFNEINTADFRGIDTARDIRRKLHLAPFGGGESRVWLIDECHKLTSDAQNGLLKTLEDTPDHVYFFLCTTEPERLLQTIKTRCTYVAVRALDCDEMEQLVKDVCKKEGIVLDEVVVEKIVAAAEGSARKALVILNSVMGQSDVDKQLEIIHKSHPERDAIEIARMLLKGTSWASVARVLKEIPELENKAEGIRRLVLSYMASVALGKGGDTKRTCEIIECFAEPYFNLGKAGLVSSCYDAVMGR